MIQEYDIVKSLTDLNDRVLKGCIGTVLLIYPDFPNSYEVEFVNEIFETIDVLTVQGVDLVKLET